MQTAVIAHNGQGKGYKGMGMEGGVARWYATNTGKSLEEFRKLARRMASTIRPGSAVLEVAPGPGYFAIELAKLGNYAVTGLDISKTFVQIAQQNAKEAGTDVDFQGGNASSMPFADKSFDLIVCRAAFKNFSDPVGALREMRRVLKPGGTALIIDLRRDASTTSINAAVDKMGMAFASAIFTKLTFRMMLLKRAYTIDEMRRFADEGGFKQVAISEDPIGFEASLHA